MEVESLLHRIERLERLVYSNSVTEVRPEQGVEDAVARTKALVETTVALEKACPALQDITRLAHNLNLEQHPSQPDEEEDEGEDSASITAAKAAAVAAALPDIERSAALLRRVRDLSSTVASPTLVHTRHHAQELRMLEAASTKEALEAAILREKVDALVTSYGRAMAVLNETFVSWDETLVKLEAERGIAEVE